MFGRLPAVPLTMWIVTALWGSLLLGASVLWPMTYGPDEAQHIDMAYAYSAHPFRFYRQGELVPAQGIANMYRFAPAYPPKERLAVAPIPLRGDRTSFAEQGGHTPTTGIAPNQMTQHPPLYYWAAAVVLRLPGVSGQAWDLQVWLLRLLSVLFMLPVPILCWAAAERLLRFVNPVRHARQLAVLAGVIPLSVPSLIRVGASVTNDSLLILATSVVLYGVCRVFTGDLSRRTGIWLAVALAAALWTKGFALVLPPIVLAAYLIGASRVTTGSGARLRVPWRALVAPALGTLVGAVWWVRNLKDFGTLQVHGYGPTWDRIVLGQPDHHGSVLTFLPQFASDFIPRIYGGLGFVELPSPGPFLVYGWFLLVALGIVAALFLRGRPGSRLRNATLFASVVLTLLVVLYGSFSVYRTWSAVPRGTQGRFLYQLIVVVAALAAVGWLHLVQPRFRRFLPPLTLIAAVATNAVAWLVVVRSWYAPRDATLLHSLTDGARGVFRWSPVPMPVTGLVVWVLPPVAAVLAVVVVVRDGLRLPRTVPAADARDGVPAAASNGERPLDDRQEVR